MRISDSSRRTLEITFVSKERLLLQYGTNFDLRNSTAPTKPAAYSDTLSLSYQVFSVFVPQHQKQVKYDTLLNFKFRNTKLF